VTIDLSPIHFSGDDAKVVRAIRQHPRLSALLPAGIEPLVTGYVTAKATAAAVEKLKKADAPDFAALLDADLKSGKQPDAAALVKQYATAQREAAEIRAVVTQLNALPARYHADIVREVQAAAETFPEALADDLDEILDRGAPLVAALDGINNADQAMDAERENDWRTLKALTVEYAEVRDAQMALLRAEDTAAYPPGSPNVLLAMFAGAEDLFPGLGDLIDRGLDAFRRADLGWPATDYTSPLHLLAVLRHRNVLQPCVARASEVGARRDALYDELSGGGNPAPKAREPRDWGAPLAAAGGMMITERPKYHQAR
jgi:hypothetical protein